MNKIFISLQVNEAKELQQRRKDNLVFNTFKIITIGLSRIISLS